jgi:hypothetical protein
MRMRHMTRLIGAATVALFAIDMPPHQAGSAPPENADPALAPWFNSLNAPAGGSCCSQSDGRPVAFRIVGNHYEAEVGTQFPHGPDPPVWIEVPAKAVLQNQDNPTGRAILFWTPTLGVLCFVRPSET